MLDRKIVHMTLTDLYMGVICIFPIATILMNEGVINKILFAVLIGLQVGMLFDRRIRKRSFIVLFMMILNYVYALYNTKFPLHNTNLLLYFPFYLIYTYFMCDNSKAVLNWFKTNKQFLTTILLVWNILVGISVFFPSSYYIKEGGSAYFGSFCGTIFRLGPAAVFAQALAIMMQMFHGSRKAFLGNLLPVYSYFMGSSRTYLGVGLCLLMVSWYIFCEKKKTFWHSLIPFGIAVVIALSMSSMGDKIAFTLDEEQYGDFWFRVTSSRSVLWEIDLTAWSQLPLLSQLLGGGMNFCYEASGRWGHNDFVELICSMGIAGIIQYLVSIGMLLSTGGQAKKTPVIINVCLFFAWLVNAFFNMHYVYFCAMLCYPFLVMGVREYFSTIAPTASAQDTELQATVNPVFHVRRNP